MTAIRFENVSKRYLMRRKRQLIAHHIRKRLQSANESFWALREVSFTIKSGETVGIVGHNGAGKSTLLKLLAGIALPTSGSVEHRGKIGAMMAIGTGFHPDLTGVENIFLNAALLGMSKKEVQSKLASIVEFSEIADFIDEPARTYSNGMLSRLGFSVIVHLDPQIIILDEVLSVGDIEFQHKSAQKMNQLVAGGSTVVLVSHNLDVLASLCDRILWLDHGRVKLDGSADEILPRYQSCV